MLFCHAIPMLGKVGIADRYCVADKSISRHKTRDENVKARMVVTRCIFGAALMIAALGFAVAPQARADNFPSRAIHIVVPFPPGGLNDNVARIVQPYLQEKLGQTIVIDNRPGASGMIGSEAVAKATPDGYTLLVVASSHTVIPATKTTMAYEADKSFAAIGLMVRDPLLFVVPATVPANTLGAFVALAKSQPGKLNYATPGSSSQSHFVTELFDMKAGIKMTEVPYRGGAPAALSLIKGETQFAVLSTQLSVPQIEAGKIRAIASGGKTRSSRFPDLPTLGEAGYPGMEALQWVGMLAPAGTPKDVVGKLSKALNETLTIPDVVKKLGATGMTAAPTTPNEFQALLTSEVKQWRDVGQKAGIKAH
jgi:tripartite-type tricarboxylate transporter receptor subunit TctC